MIQLSIFDQPSHGSARRSDPQTSKDAAVKVDAQRLEKIVLEMLQWYPQGLTTHEIADRARIALVSISPRMAPLERKGRVEKSGERRNGSIVWRSARVRK